MSVNDLRLTETRIVGKTVHMRLANHEDPEQATEWIDFQVVPQMQKRGDTTELDPERLFLGEIRLSALDHVRTVIGAEIQRLSQFVYQLR